MKKLNSDPRKTAITVAEKVCFMITNSHPTKEDNITDVKNLIPSVSIGLDSFGALSN
jgi:hypothetical protein